MSERELLRAQIGEYFKETFGEEDKEVAEVADRIIKQAEEEELTEPVIIWTPYEFKETVIYNPYFLEKFVLPEKLKKIRDSIMPNYEETFKVFNPLRKFIFNLDNLREWLVKKREKEFFGRKDIEGFRDNLIKHYSSFKKEVEKYSKDYPEIVETITSIVDALEEDIRSYANMAIHYSYDPSAFYKEIDNLIRFLHFAIRGYFDLYNDAFVTSYEAIKEKSKEKLGEIV